MNKEKMMMALVKAKYPAESVFVGNHIIKELIMDYYNETPNALELYRQSDDGFNLDIMEMLVLIFTGIQALDSLLNVLGKYLQNKNDLELHKRIYAKLLEYEFEPEDAERCCNEIIKGI